MSQRFNPVTVQQATQNSPALASLTARAQDMQRRLAAVEDLIPAELRGAVLAGPAEGESWCLLVRSNAAAAKLRQLAPLLAQRLRRLGWPVDTLRIKLLGRR